jgi:predicted nucleic acid-binding protein
MGILLVAGPLALTEVHQVVTSRAGRTAADGVLRSLSSRVRQMRLVLAPATPEILDTALTVRARYASLDLDLVDAVNVALAAEYDTDAVLTRDLRDFRPSGRCTADTPASGSSPTTSDRRQRGSGRPRVPTADAAAAGVAARAPRTRRCAERGRGPAEVPGTSTSGGGKRGWRGGTD